MKIGTVKGTRDYLPAEVALREFMQNSILETYRSNGFERIMTPAIEDIENLEKSEGGENLNLIFKILKRGDKLNYAIQKSLFDELADMGLRYDLTLPLCRYYANNRSKLTIPFKCIQIDKVYRAERPQKGRMREFVQCDIDIIGSDSIYCEIELIDVTAKALLALGLKNFRIRINDRNILLNILQSINFKPNELESVCTTIDKLDKTGVDGVRSELSEKRFAMESIDALASILGKLPLSLDYVKSISTQTDRIENLEKIISCIKLLSENKYDIEFDLSLVRGQGYYSGTVFEIECKDFNSSVAGGGRYDNLIGKFINEKVPAVGFSIGFERIFSILTDSNFVIPNARKKIAVFFEDNYDNYIEASKRADELRKNYDAALFEKPKKLNKFLNSLLGKGFYGFIVCGQMEEIEIIK